ncbi:hypothetical protein HaLaN_02822 [Haematococcus lacustris]|uniref:BACK domain-containing protein n=1 Tax=Haematococcus lacustris TaxID=44745 RepID=A0A699YJ58_HAELA|nr:hypothetical protein HaLaN_02822 [Haematococcus lacustris]
MFKALLLQLEYFKARLLRWAGSESQGAASFQPSTVVAHFGKTGSLPSGLTASQLAQETFDSQAECDAARLVVRCMYEGELAEELAAEQLVLVLQTLPDSCALLPEHKKWQQLVDNLVVSLYRDVHAVITSAQLRTTFQQLPFAAVQQWAGSDELTVDSENSVVELLSLWMAGQGGQACSKEQKQQLSCLLQPVELQRRTTIRWDVPRQQLVDLLASKDLTEDLTTELEAEQLVLVLQTLPDSCALLPEHKKWQARVHSLAGELNALPILLHLYGDVHAVITSAKLRGYFQLLPFAAVQQWAGSDALTVDMAQHH